MTGFPSLLLSEQKARFAELDSGLPAAMGPPEGERLDATTVQGRRVVGIVQTYRLSPDSPDLLWSAAEVSQLFPFVGSTGRSGMDALLTAWRRRFDAEPPGLDSSCTVNWPSQDAEAITAFLDHGFVPTLTLAVRIAPPPPVTSIDVTIRRARPDDFDDALELAVSAADHVGLLTGRRRPNSAEILAPQLRRKLDEAGPVWLAEQNGEVIALAECDWIDSAAGSPAAELLPDGRWGYVNDVITVPRVRRRGIGQALMALAHSEFEHEGVFGSYLYYNPHNSLSTVFWHRQGYRPLWTMWEMRPASARR